MPELPEIEAIAQTLRPLVKRQQIPYIHVLHPIATKPQSPSHLARTAEGQRILAVKRRGKYLYLQLPNAIITLHFKLDGQLLWFSSPANMLAVANQPVSGVHVDVAFELSTGVLAFADSRHFGRVQAWDSEQACPALANLGIDALSTEFTPALFAKLLAASKRPIKDFLLDQSHVAGVGNIYSCESFWHAKLNPRRRAHSLNASESRRLHKAIVSVLARALECCVHPPPDFRDADWWFQGLENILRVYDREGKPCRRCRNEIKRIAQGGRSTYFCAHCQR